MSVIPLIIFFLLRSEKSSSIIFDFEERDFANVKLCEGNTLMNITLNETVFIESPSYSVSRLGYDPDLNCKIVINGLNGTSIFKITFDVFDLETNKVCAFYDYVKIYRQAEEEEEEKEKNGWFQVLDSSVPDPDGLCGTKARNTLTRTTTGQNLFIHFKTDSSINGKGFNASILYYISDGYPIIDGVGYEDMEGEKNCPYCRLINVNQNENITLNCYLKETKTLTEMKWFKIDNTSNSLKEIRIDIIKNDYKNGTIELVELALDDEGAYICRASNRFGTVVEKVYIKIIEKCSCPQIINVTWYEYLPYTMSIKEFDNQQMPVYKGIFYEILEAMIPEVCGDCLRGHGKSSIYWNEQSNRQKLQSNVLIDIENHHLALPIIYLANQEKFKLNYFVPIIKAPGYLLLQKPNNDGGKKVFKVLFMCSPLLIIVIATMICAGIIIWMLEIKWNSQHFPKSFVKGVWQGTWWAFVTMTTVGYGDIAPRGYLGRIFGLFWMICGVVLISILTGAISTGLIVASLSDPIDLHMESVGAINQSSEFKYAVTQINNVKGYKDYISMIDDLNAGKIKSILVDNYVAGAYQELYNLTINNRIPMDNMAYGIVLGNHMNKKEMHQKMLNYLKKEQMKTLIITANNLQKYLDMKPYDLFDRTNPMFISALLTMFGLLVLFICGGLAFDYGYHKPKQREILNANNLDMIESKKVKEMAKSTPITRDDILADLREQLQYASERINNINKMHIKQKEFFLEKKNSFKKEDEERLILNETKDETQV